MHEAAFDYVGDIAAELDLDGATVLEIGSYNVNGTIRPHFDAAAEYVGIDHRDGPGVDAVAEAFDGGGAFDVVVCCEVLEHASDPGEVILTAWQALKPGGVLILTAAGPGRPEHNTMGGGSLNGEHYANIEPDELEGLLKGWDEVVVEYAEEPKDVYAVARKPAPKARKRETKVADTPNLSGA